MYRATVSQQVDDDRLARLAKNGLPVQVLGAEDSLAAVTHDFVTGLQARTLTGRSLENAADGYGHGTAVGLEVLLELDITGGNLGAYVACVCCIN